MPTGRGWWIAPDGHAIAVDEHRNEIVHRPGTFGLSPTFARPREGETDASHRVRVLTAAMRRGFARVRTDHGDSHIELWRLTRRMAVALARFVADELGAGPGTALVLNELSTGVNLRLDGYSALTDGTALLRRLRAPRRTLSEKGAILRLQGRETTR